MKKVVCDRCEHNYDNQSTNICPKCSSSMKRPSWQKDKVWITKNLFVASVLKYGSTTEYVPIISNFYFDGDTNKIKRNKIVFNTQERLRQTLSAVNAISTKIGWKQKEEHLEDIKKAKLAEVLSNQKVEELLSQYPSTVLDVLSKFDPKLLEEDGNLHLTKELINNLNNTIYKTQENVKVSFKNIIKRLSGQDETAMDELCRLLDTNSLLEITSVTRILMSRLATLEMFEELIINENTYEIKGDQSIQSILERNMWILNEEWWLVQANRPLKKFIGNEIEKEKGRLRPDFVCVNFEGKLIIVDIKRPSHEISKEDIDQVENYKIIAKEYKGESYKSIECYLVGKKIPSQAKNIANERRNISLLTYNDLTEEVKRKYVQYLEAMSEARKKETERRTPKPVVIEAVDQVKN